MFNCKNCPYFTKRLVDLKRHKKYEEIHNLRINRKIGTPNHLKMALKSHVNWNSLNTGFISKYENKLTHVKYDESKSAKQGRIILL